MNKQIRIFVRGILALLLIIFVPVTTAQADQPPHHHGQIVVEDVSLTPASAGDQGILRLRLTNDSYSHAHLLEVKTPVASEVRIVARMGDGKMAALESISVRADEALDLTSDHLWIELGSLVRPVKMGETIPIELVFLRSRLWIEAHVHGASG